MRGQVVATYRVLWNHSVLTVEPALTETFWGTATLLTLQATSALVKSLTGLLLGGWRM